MKRVLVLALALLSGTDALVPTRNLLGSRVAPRTARNAVSMQAVTLPKGLNR